MALFKTEKQQIPKTLKERYGTNPFSILRADTGDWIKRKTQWEYILHDRQNNVRDTIARGNTPYINNFADKPEFKGAKSPNAGMISTFDPFFCEILVKWFSEENDVILDPFAGGIVRGGVASILNRHYIGIDISDKQIEHNKEQWKDIYTRYQTDKQPQYIIGNSADELLKIKDESVNLILSCPPYYNLEKYTDNAADLSNLPDYNSFYTAYSDIINKCYSVCKSGAFMVLVVEEIRDKNGNFYGLVPDTIRAGMSAGFNYYNELILVNPIASLGIRSVKYFEASRKVGRHHQNVLVFKKG